VRIFKGVFFVAEKIFFLFCLFLWVVVVSSGVFFLCNLLFDRLDPNDSGSAEKTHITSEVRVEKPKVW